jgi:capsid protein
MMLPGFIRRLFGSQRGLRPEIAELAATVRQLKAMEARYAAAGDAEEMATHWAQTDALDADTANSLAVRKKLRERSRLEQGNNGYACGMVRTHANYVVGRGPTLRMQSGSPTFNAMIEARWQSWCKAVWLARKLRTTCKAKTGVGEGFLEIVRNPGIAHLVKMDVRGIECDQVTTPSLPYGEAQHIDGVQFDEFGNPLVYEVLPYHPGSQWSAWSNQRAREVPARFMLHWFSEERPGQHRGIPDDTATLQLHGQGRRYREAVIAAAETAADFAAILEMAATNEGPDEVRPFSTLPIEKRMLVAGPAGAKLSQLRAEQPATAYKDFNRSIVSEAARPRSMSYSIAACDSTGNSFSGTQNDHLIYYQEVDAERADCESLVLDKLFAVWFELAAATYAWSVPNSPPPRHTWGWPPMPQVQALQAAKADKAEMELGIPPTVIIGRRGFDFEDMVRQGARDYGITEDEYRARVLGAAFQKAGAAAPVPPSKPPAAAGASRLWQPVHSSNGD